MPTPPIDVRTEEQLKSAALEELRRGANPFSTAVAAVGTIEESLQTDVRSHTDRQLTSLLQVVQQYRNGKGYPTRIYPVVGDPGTGKTHLLYILRAEVQKGAIERGEETMFLLVDHLALDIDPIDYLYWQLTNHIRGGQGPGERLLQVLAGRLMGRLLAESLRRLAPHQQAGLIPPSNLWEWIKDKFGSSHLTRRRIGAIGKLIELCDGESPSPQALKKALGDAKVPDAKALKVIQEHLERMEPENAAGWFRKQLYSGIARLALLDDRGPFVDFHDGVLEPEPPSYVVEGKDRTRRLLDTWLELLGSLSIPVVVVFDQLEDYLRAPTPQLEASKRRAFLQAISSFVDKVPSVCVLTFAAQGVWTELLNEADDYSRGRLTQGIALPGRPQQQRIEMPDRLSVEVIEKLIEARLRRAFPTLNRTGLPSGFPFPREVIGKLSGEKSIRECIRKLGDQYDSIVFPTGPAPEEIRERLRRRLCELWHEQLAAMRTEHGVEFPASTSVIPKFQNALDGWLQFLHREGITGAGPWTHVEVVTKPERQQYGYLTVIRLEGPNLPGLGIAGWFGQRAPKLNNLRKNLDYFHDNPCPVKTLALLREDGEAALEGKSGEAFKKALSTGLDVRVAKCDVAVFHAVMGFSHWQQTAASEVEAVGTSGVDGKSVFREFVLEVSRPVLCWIDEWRQPVRRKEA